MTIDEAMNPTIDDAIKRLEGMVFTSDFSPQTLRAIAVNKLALVALKEKAERECGCVWCKEDNKVFHDGKHLHLFCSYCGRKLEVKQDG